MPKIQDYACRCGERFEYLSMGSSDLPACPSCGSPDVSVSLGCAKPFGTIVPTYPGALKQKAGYVHTHGDRPAEKGSVAVPRKADV